MSGGSDSQAGMGFWDHVDELRSVILRILGVVGALAVAMWLVLPGLMDSVILAPTRSDFITYRALGRLAALTGAVPDFAASESTLEIINIRLASQFFIHASLSLWLAVTLAFPGIVMLLWGFVAPGLHAPEKRGAGRTFALGTVMFYLGVATGYLLVFPLTLRFLADYSLSDSIANTLSLDSYMDNFLTLTLMMGLLFELPAVAWMLGRAGLLRRGLFTRYRRHAIVGLLALAAVITPSGDPFTLLAVFVPVYMLWEVSALLVPRSPSVAASTLSNPQTAG